LCIDRESWQAHSLKCFASILDGYEDADSGWPRVLKEFAAEAWRRAEAGEITEEEFYPSDAQWCGLYDRMQTHEPEETARRFALAADCGEAA
jgi:hypothetical protein